MPFLTDVDERAQVKGSRDPLGLVPIWSRFGREVVGNLTTVTNTVRGFTTLLLGLYFAEQIQEIEREDTPSTLDLFLKFEQMAGYARVRHNGERSLVRGLRRINSRLSERKRVTISAAPSDQILSNQKVYGLWGLFSMASRSSELLLPNEQRLTPAAREFIQRHYLPLFPNGLKNARAVIDLLRKESFIFDVDSDLSRAIAKIHGNLKAVEREFYRDHLAWGGEVDTTGGKQQQLAEILKTIDGDEFGFREFEKVEAKAAKLHLEPLVDALGRIGTVEHLLMPARVAFGYLLTQNNQTVQSIANRMAKEWKRPPRVDRPRLESLRKTIADSAGSAESANRWLEIASLIDAAEYARLIAALVDMNTRVMQARGGSAAWLTIDSGRLRVRMADETEELLPAREVENLWRSTYFINSLWNVSREVA